MWQECEEAHIALSDTFFWCEPRTRGSRQLLGTARM